MKGYMYILECSDGTYYTGSTVNLERRLFQHKNGEGANYTKKRLPVNLVYFEEYTRIDEAFYREKQVQNWSHAKKKALIESDEISLHVLSECKNESHSGNAPLDSARGALDSARGALGSARGAELP
jgi:putative endonuclease